MGEYEHEPTQKSNNQNASVQNPLKDPKLNKPSADLTSHDASMRANLSTDRASIDEIAEDMENAPSHRLLR